MRQIKPVLVVQELKMKELKMRKNKSSKNWTCAVCPHIGKPHPLDSTDLCRSSSWKHQQSWNFLLLFCLKLAKDIYLHESGRPATDVAMEREKSQKPTKPNHFPFLNIALSVVHCCSPLWSSCLNSETLRFITTHNIMIQDSTSVDGFSPMSRPA